METTTKRPIMPTLKAMGVDDVEYFAKSQYGTIGSSMHYLKTTTGKVYTRNLIDGRVRVTRLK